MRKVLERTPSFGTRVFTDAEREYCERRRHPFERYAARFAAKEAVMKAMGVGIGSCPMRAIEVVSASSGAPGGDRPRGYSGSMVTRRPRAASSS